MAFVDPLVTAEHVERFRALASRWFGLRFEDAQLGFLADILRRRLERGVLPERYLAELEATDPSRARDEARALACELTVNETYFFRHADQFKAFREVALAERLRARTPERRLRILSAGCASGEEAYSIAIMLRERPDTVGWELGIHGIDIDSVMLEKAAVARYTPWALRETPPEIQARYFQPAGAGRELALDPAIREMVTFAERNLIDPAPTFWQRETYDVIFCRNVLMYLTPTIAEAIVARLARSLVPGGFLFLGHAETLRGLSHDFDLQHTHGTFYYRRRSDIARAIVDTRGPPAHRTEDAASSDDRWSSSSSDDRWSSSAPSELLPSDTSWVDTIRRASERVDSLTSAPATPAASSAVVGSQRSSLTSWDLGHAIELLRQERFSEAGVALTQLPVESDRDADVLLLKAVVLSHGGDLAAAEKLCAKVLQIDPMSAGAHYLTALCREDAGAGADAADHDRVAAYLDPGFAMPRLHLGLLARRGGDQAAARRELAEALVLLQREDASRLLLFAGGFGREALMALCRAELASCGSAP